MSATPDGGFLIVDESAHRVRRISRFGIITAVAGSGKDGFAGDGGAATKARLSNPADVAATADGGFLIADSGNGRIRRVDTRGGITTVAGTADDVPEGFIGDGGPATSAPLRLPESVAALPDGGFLVIDEAESRVRRVSPDGVITTVAGTGSSGFSGDGGPATAARLDSAVDVAATPDGGFLIADSGARRVRRVAPEGTISTVAGTGQRGHAGDGGPATRARLTPFSVAATRDGGFLVGDSDRVRRVTPAGTIKTVAGRRHSPSKCCVGQLAATNGYRLGDGTAAATVPLSPDSVDEAADGGVLIAESNVFYGGAVRYVAPPAPVLLAAALLDGRGVARSTAYRAVYRLSRPARAELRVFRHGRSVAVARTPGRALAGTVTLRGPFAPGPYTIEIGARSGGATAVRRSILLLGGALRFADARRVVNGDRKTRITRAFRPGVRPADDFGGPSSYRVPVCHRFAATRIDCETEVEPGGTSGYSCDWVEAVTLRRDGRVFVREYGCPRGGRELFSRRPQWRGPPARYNLAAVFH